VDGKKVNRGKEGALSAGLLRRDHKRCTHGTYYTVHLHSSQI
jgi:hypothetical protein